MARSFGRKHDTGDNPYISYHEGAVDSEGNAAPWVITQKGTGKVLSHHATREEAEESFRAMEMSKHGG